MKSMVRRDISGGVKVELRMGKESTKDSGDSVLTSNCKVILVYQVK